MAYSFSQMSLNTADKEDETRWSRTWEDIHIGLTGMVEEGTADEKATRSHQWRHCRLRRPLQLVRLVFCDPSCCAGRRQLFWYCGAATVVLQLEGV